jgi:hypothetical protein
LQMSLLCVASGSLTMSQPYSSSSSSNPRFRVWSPDPRLQLEVPKPGLNPGSSKPNIGVSSPASGPGLDPRAAWSSQTRSQSRFFEAKYWGLSPDPILGKSQNYGFLHFWNGFVYLCTQKYYYFKFCKPLLEISVFILKVPILQPYGNNSTGGFFIFWRIVFVCSQNGHHL